MTKHVLRTYAEWNDLGYNVIAGQKMVGRDEDNTPLFAETQVRRKQGKYYRDDEELDFEGRWSEMGMDGDPNDYGSR